MKILLFMLFCIINYVVGSINGGLVIGQFVYHVDIRQQGSHNLGATNAGRILGKKASIFVTLIDALKGAIVFWILSFIHYDFALLSSFFCAVGHCYPVFANFRGGKAVATTYGLIFAICISSFKEMIVVFFIPLLIWFVIKRLTDLVSLASLFSILFSAVLATFVCDIYKTLLISLLFALMAYRHKDNIVRLINGTESKANY